MGGERERRRPESGRSPRGAGRHKCPATPRLHSDTAPSPAPPQPLPPTADCLQIQIPESAPPVPGCLLASLPVAAARQGGGDAGGRGRVTGTHTHRQGPKVFEEEEEGGRGEDRQQGTGVGTPAVTAGTTGTTGKGAHLQLPRRPTAELGPSRHKG